MTNLPENLLLTIAALAILPGTAAWADRLAINLIPSTLSAMPGQTITFSGTITNLVNATVDLNSCDVNLAGTVHYRLLRRFPAFCTTFSGAPRDPAHRSTCLQSLSTSRSSAPSACSPPASLRCLEALTAMPRISWAKPTFAVVVTSVAAPSLVPSCFLDWR